MLTSIPPSAARLYRTGKVGQVEGHYFIFIIFIYYYFFNHLTIIIAAILHSMTHDKSNKS